MREDNPTSESRAKQDVRFAASVSDITSFDVIDDYVEQQMRRLNIPGASLAIVVGDRIVHERGFGKARPGGEVPTSQTPFVLGSTTKSFTALAVMQLVEAGKINLDAPVQCYLPWFRVADPRASEQMTVRHLLNQTSGFPMMPGLDVLADVDDSPAAAERQMRGLAALKLTRPVGAEWEYSNLNYILLGLIVEAASGEGYDRYVQKHIFTPLGMHHSYTSPTYAKRHGLAVGHRYWFTHPIAAPNFPIARGSLAAGQLISCAQDMARYLIAHLNDGRCGSAQILSAAGIAELRHGAADVRVSGVSMGQYAMGLFTTHIGPYPVVHHGGNVPDFSSFIGLLPEQKQGVVLLINADHGLPMILEEVGLGLVALLAGQQPTPMRFAFFPWLMRAMLLIPLLQIVDVAATLGLLRRRASGPAQKRRSDNLWRSILLPLIPNLSLAAIPIVVQVKGARQFLRLFLPDAYWLTLICGGFAGLWSCLRTGLMVRAVREPERRIPDE
jgi:CubicO group peptidase (beta-lactamase class C family)